MIERLYESHTYSMWLAEIVYHVAFRYKKPHARLLNVRAVRQSLSWSTQWRLPGSAPAGPELPTVQRGGGLKHAAFTLNVIQAPCRTERHSGCVSTNSNSDFVQQQQKVFLSLRINSITFGKFYTHLTSSKLCFQVKELISSA